MKNHLSPKLLFAFPLLVLVSLGLSSNASAVEKANELKLLNWSEYLDPDLIRKFEKQYNAKIVEVYFETDDTRDALLLASDGRGYDLIMLSGLMVEKYSKRGWLSTVSETDVPNLKHIDKKWRNAFSEANNHAVPFFWGTLGIAYRKDLLREPVTSWKQIMSPSPEMKGKILMIKSARDLVGAALSALGYSLNTTDPEKLTEAEILLNTQKPYVHKYSYLEINPQSPMVKGDIVIAMLYNGDAMMLQQHNNNIKYVFPQEGGQLWCDYWTVSKFAHNKKLAFDFLNFINQPEHAAQQAQYSFYATPNMSANKLLPKDFLNNPVIYPNSSSLEKAEPYRILPARASKKLNTIYSRIIN